jgi:hypothetical protein
MVSDPADGKEMPQLVKFMLCRSLLANAHSVSIVAAIMRGSKVLRPDNLEALSLKRPATLTYWQE